MEFKTTLLPCPFCASRNISFGTCTYGETKNEGRFVECEDCGASTHAEEIMTIRPKEKAEHIAAEKWNRRSYP